MKGIEIAVAAMVAGAACAALLAAVRRAAQRQQATDRQLAALAATVTSLQARVVELGRRTAVSTQGIQPISTAADNDPEPKTLAVMAAAATAFLGKAAQVRSARPMSGSIENVSPWSQQGRVIVQTSHNLRGRE